MLPKNYSFELIGIKDNRGDSFYEFRVDVSDKETLDVWLKQFPWIWVCSRTKKTSSDIYKVQVSVVPFFDRMLTVGLNVSIPII